MLAKMMPINSMTTTPKQTAGDMGGNEQDNNESTIFMIQQKMLMGPAGLLIG